MEHGNGLFAGRRQLQQGQDQRHPYIDAVLCLSEICGPWILVHLHGDLVDSGQGMEHQHVLFSQSHLVGVQDIEILQPHIVLLIEETLLLHSGHIQQIQLGHDPFQPYDFFIGDVSALEQVGDIVGNPQLFGGNEYELDVMVSHQSLDQGMHRAPEL